MAKNRRFRLVQVRQPQHCFGNSNLGIWPLISVSGQCAASRQTVGC